MVVVVRCEHGGVWRRTVGESGLKLSAQASAGSDRKVGRDCKENGICHVVGLGYHNVDHAKRTSKREKKRA